MLTGEKIKGRNEASRHNFLNFDFRREALLRAFRFAALCHY